MCLNKFSNNADKKYIVPTPLYGILNCSKALNEKSKKIKIFTTKFEV